MVIREGLETLAAPIQTDSGTIDVVSDFKYLGAIVTRNGGVEMEVTERSGRALRVFGILRKPMFRDKNLSMNTKQFVYESVVLGTLLYGAETWANKSRTTQKLEASHTRCMKSILGITVEE